MTSEQVGTSKDQRLERQLDRLRGIEKSEIRMIEADRHRFRMKYRKRDFPKASSSLTVKDWKINDPTSTDEQTTRNNNTSAKKKIEEKDYEVARSLIFTDGSVDLDKILCLHLLCVHVIDIDELPMISQKNGQLQVADEESENTSSDILPCYVVEIQRDEEFDQQQQEEEEAAQVSLPEGEREGELFRRMPAPSAAGKMPIVSTQLYNNLLLESQTRGRGSPSLEHLLKYVHTGQMLDKSNEKIADKLQPAQSSSAFSCKRSSVCKNEKFFICSDVSKLPAEQFRRISICFNTRLKNFVQTVVEILRNVNTEKMNSLLEMLKNSQTVAAKLSEMKDFINSLRNFSFISLPESFTCVHAYAIEDVNFHDDKLNKQPVAETMILKSNVSIFNDLLDEIRQSIADFFQTSNSVSESTENMLDSVSMLSIPSTINPKSSRMSFGVRKSVEKIEYNDESTVAKTYEAIQRAFNEAASARLAKNVKKSNLYTDPDRVILSRMTNSQRILVGQMCAAMKTKKINNEGMVKEKIPLPALLKPVLSRESINYLTQGTIYAKDNAIDESKAETKTLVSHLSVDLTDFIMTKIYHEMLEVESRSQLQNFMKDAI